MTVQPTPEQVLSLAPDSAVGAAALALATPASWSFAGCDDQAVWGNYIAAAAEPYAVAIDLSDDIAGPAYRCTCPSRKLPCKHALGLLLLHANNGVMHAPRLPFAQQFMLRRGSRSQATDAATPELASVTAADDGVDSASMAVGAADRGASASLTGMQLPDPARSKRQHDRAERMRAGLQELDRWLADRIRAGLAAPELADISNWDLLAARLVDAQCGSLAGRVKRVAAKVGQHPQWHEDVLEELALMHVLAVGAQHTSSLPADLADGVHVATGLASAKDEVLAGVPTTAWWTVAGVSRTREDRITVQRTWLCASDASDPSGNITWAMLLSFGVFGAEATIEYNVGTVLQADLHWYPGGIALRAIVGREHVEPAPSTVAPQSCSIADALSACGWALAQEPWLERYPMSIHAVPAPLGNGRWALVDPTGSVPLAAGFAATAELVCASGGLPIGIVGEWSADGFLPLTMWADNMLSQL
ncbi:MAG: SWIM zinc finger family protein [Actinomycetota bacterium]|jgi:hypothetical protein